MTAYKDLGDLEEDARIDRIGRVTMKGLTVAFVTDDEPGKADRYIAKLAAKFPGIVVVDRFFGPVVNTVTVKVVYKPPGKVQ